MLDSVKTRDNALDEREVLNVKFFLKQLSNEYYDMELLSKSINEPSTQKQAIEVAKSFRQKFRNLDKEIFDSNPKDLLVNADAEVTKDFTDFFALLQDVPDEL